MDSVLYLKRKQFAKKAASPRPNITRSITGYLKSPFQMKIAGQTTSMATMQCRQIVSWKQAYSPSKVPVAMRRKQSKNSIHFLQIGVYSVCMHLQPISCRMGKRKQKPAMAAASMSSVESRLPLLRAQSAAAARKNEEQQVQGKQIHLKKPLKARYKGSISR